MCVCNGRQSREYGIGWGHRDLEYRRTTVTVDSIDGDDVSFCIMGMRRFKNGYYVTLSKSEASIHATCLIDWCRTHPEDVNPNSVV